MKKDIAIQFKSVSKKFRKGRKLYLKQALLDIFKKDSQEDFWALKNINIEIFKGETVGIIGANGSGKSTILKLIAGVLTPTKGEVKVNGSLGPLIELGAGFHPELTGRENIYLNGTILGLSKKEIDKKFESIVEFGELKEFIDTPFKHYSTGMQMRLGFSLAIHVEPEIFLLDEVLAVGDIDFQKKCFWHFHDYRKKGGTIIFVSHDLNAIKTVCDRVILISHGKIAASGKFEKVIKIYQKQNS